MKRQLYVGLEVPKRLQRVSVTHCPLIEIHPRSPEDPAVAHVCRQLHTYTHLLFTSKSAVEILFRFLEEKKSLPGGSLAIAVGKATAAAISARSNLPVLVAQQETAEGIVDLLETMELTQAKVLWPHSALSRPVIVEYLEARGVECDSCVFYDTHMRRPEIMPDLKEYDEIIFTSPSTIDAFVELFGKLPDGKTLTCIGQVTEKHLMSYSY